MTAESADTAPKNVVSLSDAEPDEDHDKINIGSIQAGNAVVGGSIGEVVFLAAAAIYSKAFLETLAKHHADAFAEQVRTRFRRNGTTTEVQISIDGGTSAALVVTGDMPDEARLALLDLDVTDDEIRGKVLRWDRATSAWHPADD